MEGGGDVPWPQCREHPPRLCGASKAGTAAGARRGTPCCAAAHLGELGGHIEHGALAVCGERHALHLVHRVLLVDVLTQEAKHLRTGRGMAQSEQLSVKRGGHAT